MKTTRGIEAIGSGGALALVLLAGCGDTASGSDASVGDGSATGGGRLQLFVQAEDTITDGLMPGTSEESIADGWAVDYTRFIATIGHVHVARTSDGLSLEDETVTAFDLTAIPETGYPLLDRAGLATGRWDAIEYETPIATASTVRHESVTSGDLARMVSEGCTYLIAGTLTNPTGESCAPGTDECTTATSLSFELCLSADTIFGPCSNPDGAAGVAITEGSTATGAVTIHGDHLFFNSFPTGDEGTIERRAQWLADCDLDHDGVIAQSELEEVMASRLFVPPNYSLAGAPMVDDGPILTALDFARAQVRTQGHWNGEGECPWNGEAHEH